MFTCFFTINNKVGGQPVKVHETKIYGTSILYNGKLIEVVVLICVLPVFDSLKLSHQYQVSLYVCVSVCTVSYHTLARP